RRPGRSRGSTGQVMRTASRASYRLLPTGLSSPTRRDTPRFYPTDIAWRAIFRFSVPMLIRLRKSRAGFGDGRDKAPDPTGTAGVTPHAGGVLPWCRTRDEGTDFGAPERPTPTDQRRPAAADVAKETFCSACSPRHPGATIPGT